MDKDNNCIPFIFENPADSDTVAACFNYLSENIDKKTVIILDNAPIHKSERFLSHLPEWEKRGLTLKFLPPYSPELSLIEILWQKIKYQWLSFSAYLSFSKLKESLENILNLHLMETYNFQNL